MSADQRVGVSAHGRDDGVRSIGVAQISEDDTRVAQQSVAAWTPERRAPKSRSELCVPEAHELDEREIRNLRYGLERGVLRHRGLSIPGADGLADVAAKEVRPHQRT